MAKPDDRNYRGIHEKVHDGAHINHNLHGGHTRLFQVLIITGELFLFMILANKGFYNAHVRHVLTDGGIQLINFGLHNAKTRKADLDQHSNYDQHQRDNDSQYDRKLRF